MTYCETKLTYMGKILDTDYFCIPKGKLTEREKYLLKTDKCIDNYDEFIPKYTDVELFKEQFYNFIDACRLEVREISAKEYTRRIGVDREL